VTDLPASVRTLARLARVLEHTCTDLSLAQYRVLAVVADGDERASILAGRLTLAKPTVTAVVDGLVERGLLKRSTVEGDRRAVRLGITAAGRRALATTEKALTERIGSLLERCDDPAAVVAALDQLRHALDAAMAERMREPAVTRR
jgi:DNA-binding MarR family transcriptional regulator